MAAATQVAAICVMLCGAVWSCAVRCGVVLRWYSAVVARKAQFASRYMSSPKSVAEEQSVMRTVA